MDKEEMHYGGRLMPVCKEPCLLLGEILLFEFGERTQKGAVMYSVLKNIEVQTG